MGATSTPVSDPDDAGPVPVVLWHGMGDSAAGMVGIANILEDNIPSVYVHRIMIGGNLLTDTESGFFRDTNRQVREVCQMIAEDPELAGGYNAIGFSQGGQFLRAVAQRCPSPPMKNLITFGAQHQGVFGFPQCPGEMNFFCDIVRDLLNYGAPLTLSRRSLFRLSIGMTLSTLTPTWRRASSSRRSTTRRQRRMRRML